MGHRNRWYASFLQESSEESANLELQSWLREDRHPVSDREQAAQTHAEKSVQTAT